MMSKAKEKSGKNSSVRIRPALTPEAREQRLISLATDLAEQQLMDGTASSQVITHYLKMGSSKEKLEREKLEEENKLLRAKTEAYERTANADEVYKKALEAFTEYSGRGEDRWDD